MRYRVFPPPEALSGLVEHLWTIEPDCCDRPPQLTLSFFATSSPCIVFQHDEGYSAITHRRLGSIRQPCDRSNPTSFVRGPITQPFELTTKGTVVAVGVELKPQALSTLLGIDATNLCDRSLPLGSFAADHLSERLLDAATLYERISMLTRFLASKTAVARSDDYSVMQSLRSVDSHVGAMHVGSLVRAARLSERQFERRFSRTVGMPPSLYLRIARFQASVRLMKAGRINNFSELAYDLGYTDQSHFNKDIRDFAGCTPTDLLRAIEECATQRANRTLIRQRIVIAQGDPAPNR